MLTTKRITLHFHLKESSWLELGSLYFIIMDAFEPKKAVWISPKKKGISNKKVLLDPITPCQILSFPEN